MDLKAANVNASAHPPLLCTLRDPSPAAILSSLAPQHFDVILLHPPSSASWAEIAALPIRQLSADPGFVFLWVGTGDSDGLERGRECLARWGFRRAEDIVWVKTNRRSHRAVSADGSVDGDRVDGSGGGGGKEGAGAPRNTGASGKGLFASQKEHCLMGIRGTVRRSTDAYFVHCNVDTDVIVWESEGEFLSSLWKVRAVADIRWRRGRTYAALPLHSDRELLSRCTPSGALRLEAAPGVGQRAAEPCPGRRRRRRALRLQHLPLPLTEQRRGQARRALQCRDRRPAPQVASASYARPAPAAAATSIQ